MKRTMAVLVVAACAGGAAFWIRVRDRRGPEGPAAAESRPGPESAPAAPAPGTPAVPARAERPERRHGIVACDFAEGSRIDPDAPPHRLNAFKEKRDAELRKWRETTVSFQFEDTTLHELTAEMLRRWGLKIRLDASVSPNIRLSASMSDATAADSMDFLKDFIGLVWVVDGEGESWLVPPEKRALYESPEGAELGAIASIDALVRADRAPGTRDPRDVELEKKLAEARVTLTCRDTALDEAARLLTFGGEPVEIDRHAVPDPAAVRISLECADEPLQKPLEAALAAAGLGSCVENGTLVLTTQDDLKRRQVERIAGQNARKYRQAIEEDFLAKSVAIDGEDLAIRDVAERISKALGVGYVIDPPTWSRAARYAFDGEPHSLREIFAALAKAAPVTVAYREGKLWFLSTQAPGEKTDAAAK